MAVTRFLNAADAALLVNDSDTVAVSGNGAGMISAEAILAALEKRFLETGHPRDLTLVHSLGLGDRDAMGTNRLAHEGMVRKVIAAHFTWSPRMQKLVGEEKIEAYCFPAGSWSTCCGRSGPVARACSRTAGSARSWIPAWAAAAATPAAARPWSS